MKVSLGCQLEWLQEAASMGSVKYQPVQHLLIKMSCQRERLFVHKRLLNPAATHVTSVHPLLTSAPTPWTSRVE